MAAVIRQQRRHLAHQRICLRYDERRAHFRKHRADVCGVNATRLLKRRCFGLLPAIDRQRCRELHARCLALLDESRPYTDPAAGLLQRVDTGPILTDGPDGEVRHSITTTLRCAVPRGAAQAP